MARPQKPESINPADPDADAARAERVTRSQQRLERRAAVLGWATPEPKKRAIIKRLVNLCDAKHAEGKTAKLRYVLVAARTLISADLRQQQLDLEREMARGNRQEGTLAELVGAAEAIANDLDRERAEGTTDPTPGTLLP